MNGREGRDEDVADEEEDEDVVACDCALNAISEKFARKIVGKTVLTGN